MAGRLQAVRDDLAALVWVAANLRGVLHSLRVLSDMGIHGGSTIAVPPDDPRIVTLVQLDGDFVTFVDPRTFTEGRSPDALSALIAQHRSALQAHLPAMNKDFGARIAGSARGARDLAVTGWAGLAALGGATQAIGWPFLLWQGLAFGLPALLHFGAPRLLRRALRRGWLH